MNQKIERISTTSSNNKNILNNKKDFDEFIVIDNKKIAKTSIVEIHETKLATVKDQNDQEFNDYMLAAVPILTEFIDEQITQNRKQELIREYLKIINVVEPECIRERLAINNDICNTCGGAFYYDHASSTASCESCGYSFMVIENSTRHMTYDQIQNTFFTTKYTYDRMSHFCDKLAQFQAKEFTSIKESVIEKVKAQMKKENISDVKKLNKAQMKNILKKCGLNQYYEHAVHILHILGYEPIQLDSYTETTLKLMFTKIEPIYEKHKHLLKEFSKHSDRKSFLNYNYVFHKFFEILKMEDCLEYFPYLKNREKLLLHDKVWQKITEELNWPYIPSM